MRVTHVPADQTREPAANETRAAWHFGVRAGLSLSALLILALPFSILVVMVTDKSSPVQRVDRGIATAFHSHVVRHPVAVHIMKLISAVGSPMAWWVVLTPVFAWLLYRRLPRLAAFVVVTALGSSLINSVLKTAVNRARPHLVDPVAVAAGKSFPSGHAQAATVGCGILVLVFLPVVRRERHRWLWIGAAAVVTAICLSRIGLGVHYLSDVLGGILIGAAWLLVMTAAFSAWRRERRLPPVAIEAGLEPDQRARIAPDTADSGSPNGTRGGADRGAP